MARRGADVIYGTMNPPLHVSGHGSAEELKLVLNLVRPRYFVPIHGEYRQLCQARRLAEHLRHSGPGRDRSCWKPATRWRSTSTARARASKVTVGRVCIDSGTGRRRGGGHRDPRPPPSFRRRHRAADHRDQQAHRPQRKAAGDRQPRLLRGRGRLRPDSRLARQVVAQTTLRTRRTEEKSDWGVMKEKIRADLKRYITKQTSSAVR